LDRGGIAGEDGPTHHGLFDLAYMRLIPNMVVMAPKDENELQHMLYTAMNYKGPTALRYPRGSGPGAELEDEFREIEIGKGEIIFKSKIPNPKSKQCIISIGSMVYPSVEAAKLLDKDGIAATVINARFVKPLDRDLILKTIISADKIVTVEEGVLEGGFGSAVLELLSEEGNSIPVHRIGLPSKFIEQGKRAELLEIYGLSKERIYEQCLQTSK
jgi:1-deoxy-D-xylulose-5-phosphate synthase